MLYARQNAPTTPDLVSGSSCGFLALSRTALSRDEVGSREQSFQSGCAAKTVSGSSQSPLGVLLINSPFDGVVGQYMSWFGLYEHSSNWSMPQSAAKKRASATYSSGDTSLVSGTIMRQRGASGVWPWVV